MAALDVENVKTAPLHDRPYDVFTVDGSMAVKGIIKDDKFEVNLAADTVRLGWRDLLLQKSILTLMLTKMALKLIIFRRLQKQEHC